jgi:hypothetical protein
MLGRRNKRTLDKGDKKMNNALDSIKKTVTRIHELGRQFYNDAFHFESHETYCVETCKESDDSDPSARNTVIAIACSESMNATDYSPTRFTCGMRAVTEYFEICAQQHPRDRAALVCFNNEARTMIHLVAVERNFASLMPWIDAYPRGRPHIDKGIRGIVRAFQRQRKSNHQRQVILLTDYWDTDAANKTSKLGVRYDAIIHVVLIGQSEVNEDRRSSLKVAAHQCDGIIHYHYARDAEGVIEHFRQLAADNSEPTQRQI